MALQNKSDAEDAKEITVTEVTADIKADETMSPPKDEKKEKVKKKRSFRSFSFLRREKKNKLGLFVFFVIKIKFLRTLY